jgi:cytoskeletal protein CcmA (bactofilin family)
MTVATIGTKHSTAATAVKQAADPVAFRMDDIVIGPGVRTVGRFHTAGSIFVDGALEDAEVECRSLSISRGAEFHGNARAERIEVSGTLNGDVTASEEVVLRSSAAVTGKVSAPYVVVHRGALLSGGVESLERQPEPAKSLRLDALPSLSRGRSKRNTNMFVGATVVGLLLIGGAAFAWLGGEPVAQSSTAQSAQ